MPIREFQCAKGHITEVITRNEEQDSMTWILCKVCGELSDRLEFSVPGQGIFYGAGFYKESVRE